VLQHLHELPTFDQGDDLLKADATLSNEPGILLLRIKGVVPVSHVFVL
jgi:hypothetical protein